MYGTRRILLVAIALELGLAGTATAAAPRLLMVSGESLDRRVLISDAEDVFKLYQAFFDGQPVDRSRLTGRRSLRLGLFWNNLLWEPYVREGRLDELRFEQANQFGRFYPATGGQPALVDVPGYGQWPKIANDTALRILEAHGVPVQAGDATDRSAWVWIGVGILGLAALGLALLFSARRFYRVNRPPDTASA